jgi:asparagine N-glycosylation enzyme membrane subunit Stt3
VLGTFVVVFLVVSCAYNSKNMRFLSPIYAPVAMLAGALLMRLANALRARLPLLAWRGVVLAAAAALVFSAWRDARRFDHYFNEMQIQDLATPWFTQSDAGLL